MNYLLSKKCLKPTTIKRKVVTIKSLLRHGVKLSDPDSFVRFLNTTSWASGTKDVAVDSYRDYLNMLGLTARAILKKDIAKSTLKAMRTRKGRT